LKAKVEQYVYSRFSAVNATASIAQMTSGKEFYAQGQKCE